MRLIINGNPSEFPDGIGIDGILNHYQVNPERVVIELNTNIIKKHEWLGAVLQNNDTLELISFVGGG
jgi:sulfur carrier protein